MSTPAWPKNLEPKPTYTLCTRCGISTHPDTRPHMCRDCVGAVRGMQESLPPAYTEHIGTQLITRLPEVRS